MRVAIMFALMVSLIGCDRDEGQRDFAGAATGPAIDVHCAGLSRFPAGVGDTQVDVNCLKFAGTVGK